MKNKISYKYWRISIKLNFKMKNQKYKNKKMNQQDYRVQKMLGKRNNRKIKIKIKIIKNSKL